jgi:tagatose-6-phosphate ketose/aldose isomerase
MTDLTQWHTWREIHAQPAIWTQFGAEVLAQRDALRAWIAASGATEVWFSGAGTSAYIGDFIAAALATTSDLLLKSVASTDLVSAPHQFLGAAKPLVVSFGRSGNSAESIGVLNVLDALCPNAPRLNITCNAQSALATRPAVNQKTIVLPDATHDQGFAMTSSYTTMLLTALTIFDPDPPADVFASLAAGLTDRLVGFATLATEMALPDRMVVTGSGALRYTAREAALKIMELTAFIAPNTHVLCLISNDPAIARYDRDLAAELRVQFAGITVTEIEPTTVNDTWGAVVQAAAAQVIAAVLSARMGLNVDDPFVGQGTLTRVVEGVTLYPPAAS